MQVSISLLIDYEFSCMMQPLFFSLSYILFFSLNKVKRSFHGTHDPNFNKRASLDCLWIRAGIMVPWPESGKARHLSGVRLAQLYLQIVIQLGKTKTSLNPHTLLSLLGKCEICVHFSFSIMPITRYKGKRKSNNN